jgi:hypothetical protein
MTALVMIELIHKHSVRSIEHEHHAPVAIDGDGPMIAPWAVVHRVSA